MHPQISWWLATEQRRQTLAEAQLRRARLTRRPQDRPAPRSR